jgi:peptidoglycan/xylan/chitin deacetylase (PgdA/CDA1 family)
MKRFYRNMVNGILYLTALILCFAPPAAAADHAVILQYHQFGSDTAPSTSVTPEQFDRHLKYFDENGFTVWPLDKIVSYLQGKKELPDKCVAITIDDAYISVYEKAFPRLRKYGWPFTVFVATEGVDRGFKSYMTWDQMREMATKGASFAGHGHTHSYLLRRLKGESEKDWRERVTRDIRTSFERIEDEIGAGSRLFAYPYGEYNNELREIVRGLGLVGLGQHSGAVWANSDFLALPRFPMAAGYAEMDEFRTKVNSLPLPVVSAEPDDPELSEGVVKPVLKLKIGDGEYQKDSLACYVNGQRDIRLKWIDRDKGVVEVAANKPLPEGRSHYSCTAKHKTQPRYFWYSHLWIRGG